MGSEQYSETPLPDVKRCPQCGEVMPSSAHVCSRCAEKHAIREGLPKPQHHQGSLPVTRLGLAGDGSGWALTGGVAILVCIALLLPRFA